MVCARCQLLIILTDRRVHVKRPTISWTDPFEKAQTATQGHILKMSPFVARIIYTIALLEI